MSQESKIYGCIVGVPGTASNWSSLYLLNQAAIQTLAPQDNYPPLTPNIFTVPMDYAQSSSALFRAQMIHFGASFNHMSDCWHLWLEKFERLLKQLYWEEASLHLDIELYGRYEYRWRASWPEDDIPPWHRPQATTEWTFEGGPRDFRAV